VLVGIVANQMPVINADEASKGTQFIRMCNQQYVQGARGEKSLLTDLF